MNYDLVKKLKDARFIFKEITKEKSNPVEAVANLWLTLNNKQNK